MIELLRTQGMWPQSLRLAYQQCIHGAVGEPEGCAKGLQDIETGIPACPSPSEAQLQARLHLSHFASGRHQTAMSVVLGGITICKWQTRFCNVTCHYRF